jgi:hypothetical protein
MTIRICGERVTEVKNGECRRTPGDGEGLYFTSRAASHSFPCNFSFLRQYTGFVVFEIPLELPLISVLALVHPPSCNCRRTPEFTMTDQKGSHEARYLEFVRSSETTGVDGKPMLNKYSTHLTREHDFPGAQAMQTAPHVGIASVWWEGNPCNMHLMDLGKEVKKAVNARGMLAWQYSENASQ